MLDRLIYEIALKNGVYARGTVLYKRHRISVELADSFVKKMIGLMHRPGIGEDEGMLFVLSSPSITMASITMLSMRFSIDAVWLDGGMRIVDIARNLEPSRSIFDTHAPKREAKYVLELKAGTAKRLGMKAGDRLELRLRRSPGQVTRK
jgi:uncharacterized membrane protein (UPF0127 family)